MLQITYYVAASLDGFIATPDGSVEWLAPFEDSSEDYGYAVFLDSVDALIMGSRTYEQVIGFDMPWPYAATPTWVVTQRGLDVRPGVTLTSDPPVAVAAELERRGHEHVWLVGGGALAQSFRQDGLVTGYIVSVMPVILGEGIRLFGGGGEAESLRLVESISYDSGVVQLHYVGGE